MQLTILRTQFVLLMLAFVASIAIGAVSPTLSVLSNGQQYSIEIAETGIYELSGAWLNEQVGLPLGSIPIEQIKIYGIPGGPLSERSIWEQTERLDQLPIRILGDTDGTLDATDRLLFYAEGASTWRYDSNQNSHEYLINPYAITGRYIIVISEEPHKAMPSALIGMIDNPSTQYESRSIYHVDQTNLLGAEVSNQGSGQRWLGPELSNQGVVNLGNLLSKRSQVLEDVVITAVLVGRSTQGESVLLSAGELNQEALFNAVPVGDVEELYARNIKIDLEIPSLQVDDAIELEFRKNDNQARLWLDYVTVSGTAKARFGGSPEIINNIIAYKENTNGLRIENAASSEIWDITDINNVVLQPISPIELTDAIIAVNTDQYAQYVVFDPARTQKAPSSITPLEPMNICSDAPIDMLLIYPEILRKEALVLAQHRADHSNIIVKAVVVDAIYNEYTGGRVDPTALRNYIRDLYRGGTGIQHVLLYGDASYDYRHLNENLPDENLIPTFETAESLDPLLAFPSDDYFALLDDGENGNLSGNLDVGVGRLILRNRSEAEIVNQKIIRYDKAARSAGAWRTNIAFVADDEDNNLHINDADRIASEVNLNYPQFNQSKIYLDAFVQESTPGGNRYPSATEQLKRTVEKGALVVNYLGHGGPRGWSQERVLKIDDITSWSNSDRLPLIITATCSFTGLDDPALTTAGESVLLQPNGGGIALFTTVRSVFASKNFRLTQSVFREIFEKEEGNFLPLGEIMRRAKNNIPNDNTNARKFFLIGDPSITLNIPSYEVRTDQINNTSIANNLNALDTVGALDLVQLKGHITNTLGDIAEDFDGQLDITVFDKPIKVSTLANDQGSFVKEFESQSNIIYRGKTEVVSGRYETQFRVPVDIDYSFGRAKISYYAQSEDNLDASGYNQQLVVVGSSNELLADDKGPEIQVYLNNRSFESGSTVSPINLMIVDLSDESGLNLSSASIGHEMTALLDGELILLNDFFVPSSTDPNGGVILMDLAALELGSHTMTISAFDVLNNRGQAQIDFIVNDEIEFMINQVNIMPNPFTDRISLDVFSDIRGNFIVMDLDLYTVTGQLISKQSKTASNTEDKYNASFDIEVPTSQQVLLAKVRLRDANSNIQSLPILKKIVSLK